LERFPVEGDPERTKALLFQPQGQVIPLGLTECAVRVDIEASKQGGRPRAGVAGDPQAQGQPLRSERQLNHSGKLGVVG
jgi:hypothetical protein